MTLSAVLAGSLSGCVTSQPAPVGPDHFNDLAFSTAGTIDRTDRWWSAFQDDTLTRLIDEALRGNYSLKSVRERVKEVEALSRRRSAGLWPTLDGVLTGESEREDGDTDESLSLGLDAEWVVDWNSKVRREVLAEELRAEAGREDLQAAASILAADVARTWFRLHYAHQLLVLRRDQLATNEKLLKLLKSRLGTSQISSPDVLRQQQLVERSRERIIELERRIQILDHQLAILVGTIPGDASTEPELTAVTIPPFPRTGLARAWIQNRPDLRAAYLRVEARDADLAAAIRDRFPRLTLRGALSNEADDLDVSFDDWSKNIVAELVTPILDGRRRQATVDQVTAVRNQAAYTFAQAVLEAIRDVEDAFAQEAAQLRLIASIEEQLEIADQTERRLTDNYLNGAGNYLDVLTAVTSKQDLRGRLLDEKLRRIEFRVALYAALSTGGIMMEERADQ